MSIYSVLYIRVCVYVYIYIVYIPIYSKPSFISNEENILHWYGTFVTINEPILIYY